MADKGGGAKKQIQTGLLPTKWQHTKPVSMVDLKKICASIMPTPPPHSSCSSLSAPTRVILFAVLTMVFVAVYGICLFYVYGKVICNRFLNPLNISYSQLQKVITRYCLAATSSPSPSSVSPPALRQRVCTAMFSDILHLVSAFCPQGGCSASTAVSSTLFTQLSVALLSISLFFLLVLFIWYSLSLSYRWKHQHIIGIILFVLSSVSVVLTAYTSAYFLFRMLPNYVDLYVHITDLSIFLPFSEYQSIFVEGHAPSLPLSSSVAETTIHSLYSLLLSNIVLLSFLCALSVTTGVYTFWGIGVSALSRREEGTPSQTSGTTPLHEKKHT